MFIRRRTSMVFIHQPIPLLATQETGLAVTAALNPPSGIVPAKATGTGIAQ
jgi:hypothetical protein